MNKCLLWATAVCLTALLLLSGCEAENRRDAEERMARQSEQTYERETVITGMKTYVLIEGKGASSDETVVTISKPGTYRLKGTLNDGRIIIDAGKGDGVRLIMDGAAVKSRNGSPVYGRQCGLLTIVLEDGTENVVEDGVDYGYEGSDEEPDAAIYCGGGLALEGAGSLTVTANFRNAIRGKGSLTVKSGVYSVKAANDGIKGRDSVAVEGGVISIAAGGDGIQSGSDRDAEKGFVKISGGTIAVAAEKKGILAETLVEISGGTAALTASNDAIHSGGDVKIAGGVLRLISGDDAVHADCAVEVMGGDTAVQKSHEGLEGRSVTISGGVIEINSDDDGINASGGKGLSHGEEKSGENLADESVKRPSVRITDGTVTVNASGDGIDSNGDFFMEGGVVRVFGPEDDGNTALDYDGIGKITGGTIFASGSSGMVQLLSEDSTQPHITAFFEDSRENGTEVKVTAGDGKLLFETMPPKSYDALIFSSPELEDGKTYHIISGGQDIEITLSGIVNRTGAAGRRGSGN